MNKGENKRTAVRVAEIDFKTIQNRYTFTIHTFAVTVMICFVATAILQRVLLKHRCERKSS